MGRIVPRLMDFDEAFVIESNVNVKLWKYVVIIHWSSRVEH
jgi:hypothetical protein